MLCQGGPNGIFMAVLTLAWWAAALGKVYDDNELCDALDDATWVIQHMAMPLKAGREGHRVKQARGGSSDMAAEKR